VQVYLGAPSRKGRLEVLEVHLRKFQWDPKSVRLTELSFRTEGYTGAMIANLCNVAALMANRGGRDRIIHDDFVEALLLEGQGMPLGKHTEETTMRIAIVEAATALTATLMPAIEDVEHVFVQPTEKRRLGQTLLKTNEERMLTQLYTRRYLEVLPSPPLLAFSCTFPGFPVLFLVM
jgi:cell division protease FtsH